MFRFIPNVLLKQLYNRSSLYNTPDGFTFSLKNRLADARFTGLTTPGNDISKGVPRNPANDTLPDNIRQRQEYAQQFTQTTPTPLTNYAFDPAVVQGNCEQFIGVAQVPIGLAGPLRINGEYAQGEFLIPLATTEGTLVASYNRGIKLLNRCGGVTCTVVDEGMQ